MANIKNPSLYNSILQFDIDEPDVALPFEKRLARENRWSLTFSRRVIREYKRFIYLCITAGHPCTPSDEVDQAWHLHMLYTSSYFDRLCTQTLKQTLSHEPTKGGKSEGDKFNDWYSKTLESYRQQFGEQPPADIWPNHQIRFGKAPYFQRVNVQENYVLPKKAVTRTALAACAFAVAATIIGCTTQLPNGVANLTSVVAFIPMCFCGFFILIVGLLGYSIATGGKQNRRPGGSGCSTHTNGCSHSTPFDSGGTHHHHHSGDHGHSHGDSGGSHDGGGHTGCGSSGCASSGCGSSCGGGGCGGGGD